MLKPKVIGDSLFDLGYKSAVGVPCSYLKYFINYSMDHLNYISAANEADAVAIACGKYIGGSKSILLMQNSGLANAISPLISLSYPFRIPMFGFISIRGEPGTLDEPQHKLMGHQTENLLDLIRVNWEYLSENQSKAKDQILKADYNMTKKNISFFFIIRKNIFANYLQKKLSKKSNVKTRLIFNKSRNNKRCSRYSALEAIIQNKDENTIILSTTGKTGRELFKINDSSQNFYMVGSMGCVSSIGLGLAIEKKEYKVIVIDGDGSLIMRLGSLATNAYYRPQNMLHILLDNNCHDSTGGQETVSKSIDFVTISSAAGYKNSVYVHDIQELDYRIKSWKKNLELTFLYLKIRKGSIKNLGRPSVKPHVVKERLMKLLNEN